MYLGIGVDRAPVPGPVPKSVMKAPASEIAGYVAGQKAIPEFENFNVMGSMWPTARESVVAYEQPTQLWSAAPVESAKPRELKEKAPENADILYESGRANFDPNVNLTGGSIEPSSRFSEARPYSEIDSRAGTKPPKLKGSAPEMASTVQNYYQNVAPGDSSLIDPRVADYRQSSFIGTTQSSVYSEPNPSKLKGPAPEIAAKLAETYPEKMRRLPETTLAGDISTQKPKTTMVAKPFYDGDTVVSKPSYVKPVREVNLKTSRPNYDHDPVKINPVYNEPVRSASVPNPIYSRDEDTDSVIHSDGEYVLIVGRSDYYYERQKSLRNYRSKRSRTKERDARRSMGFSSRTDSARSSISSLTESELMLCRRSRPYMSQQDVGEQRVYPTRANMSKVYAEPPLTEPIHRPFTKTCVDAIELRNNKFGAKFPLPLSSGRSAHLFGHFLNAKSIPQTCTIRLWTDEITEFNSYTAMTVELSSMGSLTVHGTRNSNPTCLASWKATEKANMLNNSQNFTIDLHARGSYCAVSINDYLTILLPESFNPVQLNHIELENSESAELDQFSVTNNLVLPIILPFPDHCNSTEMQTVSLETQMTADTKCVTATFVTLTNQVFTVLFDFEQYRVSVQPAVQEAIPVLWREIKFVPEQIRDIQLIRFTSENLLSVKANGTELLNQALPLSRPTDKLSSVRFDGQFVLLSAELK